MELITIKCMRIIVKDKKKIRKTNNRNASDLIRVLSYCMFRLYNYITISLYTYITIYLYLYMFI